MNLIVAAIFFVPLIAGIWLITGIHRRANQP